MGHSDSESNSSRTYHRTRLRQPRSESVGSSGAPDFSSHPLTNRIRFHNGSIVDSRSNPLLLHNNEREAPLRSNVSGTDHRTRPRHPRSESVGSSGAPDFFNYPLTNRIRFHGGSIVDSRSNPLLLHNNEREAHL